MESSSEDSGSARQVQFGVDDDAWQGVSADYWCGGFDQPFVTTDDEAVLDPSQHGLRSIVDLTENENEKEEVAAPVLSIHPDGISEGTVNSRAQGRDWVFTWNNYTDADVEAMKKWKDVGYLVFQFEVAPNTGTSHIQGFVQFTKRVRLSFLKKFGRAIHWEQRRGTVEQCIAYCTKSESRVRPGEEIGSPSRAGERSDLSKVAHDIVTGRKRVRDILMEDPMVGLRYSKGLQFLEQYAPAPDLVRSVQVWLYIGATGSGKTWSAVHTDGYGAQDIYIKDTTKWFDHYVAQKLIVFDDFSGASSHVRLDELLRMLDNYRYLVEVKGSTRYLAAELIIITTNIHPMKWYKYEDRQEQYNALLRRFGKIVVFKSRDEHRELSTAAEIDDFKRGVGYERDRQQE